MNKILLGTFLGLLVSTFNYTAVFAFENVESYEVDIKINKDSSINITEKVDYDFSTNLKRGIYREIDTVYLDDEKRYRLNVSNIKVYDENRLPYIFETSESNQNIRLDIGGDEPIFTGVHTFYIDYKVEAGLKHKKDHDILNWNAIGPDWQVPIYEARVEVELPQPVEVSLLNSNCYIGVEGSLDSCSNSEYIYKQEEDSFDIDSLVTNIIYEHGQQLGYGSGLTVDLRFPKGIVDEAQHEEIPSLPIIFYWMIAGGCLVSLFGIYKVYRAGKSSFKKRITVRQYDAPNNIDPGEAKLVMSRTFGNQALISELLSLAIRGYIRIVHEEKKILFFKSSKFYFLKLKPEDDLSNFEKLLIGNIFSGKFKTPEHEVRELLNTSENLDLKNDIESALEITSANKMRNNFISELKEIKEQAEKDVFGSGYFEESINKSRIKASSLGFKYVGISILVVAILALIIFFAFAERLTEDWGLIFLFLGIFFYFPVTVVLTILITSKFPKYTEKGLRAKEHLLGLKEYIEVAEKERMEFHFDPKKNPVLFEKLLPFAVILGVEDKWVSNLDDLTYQPEWYRSTTSGVHTFNPKDFSSLVSGLSSSSGASSSGGGGSGGGMGGGGGGSR